MQLSNGLHKLSWTWWIGGGAIGLRLNMPYSIGMSLISVKPRVSGGFAGSR